MELLPTRYTGESGNNNRQSHFFMIMIAIEDSNISLAPTPAHLSYSRRQIRMELLQGTRAKVEITRVADPDSIGSMDPESGSGSRRPKINHESR
jgi:hypothetical protein